MIKKPSISVNKMAEYIVSRAARQRQILRTRKYPDPEFTIGMYHKEASEAVALYIANGALDAAPLDKALKSLQQQAPKKIGTARRIVSNIDTLERFLGMLDDIDLKGGEPSLGSTRAPNLVYHNVAISVRPEIILRGTGPKGQACVGALKFHFSKTRPFDDEAAGYVSAMLQEHCRAHLATDGEFVHPGYCQVIDVASEKVYPGVKATTKRLKDIAAECQNIAGLWPTI